MICGDALKLTLKVDKETNRIIDGNRVIIASRAMGVPFNAIHGSIRFSLSRYNTMDEVDKVIEVMPLIIKKLRTLSPYGKEALRRY